MDYEEALKGSPIWVKQAYSEFNKLPVSIKKKTPFLIAQDVEAVLPEAVSRTTLKDDESGTEYLGVSYTETIPLLVAAIQELNAKVEAQALEIATLKGN